MDPSNVPLAFQDVLRYSLLATSSSIYDHASSDDDSSLEGSETFKEIVEGINFSRKFILSYQLVLVGLLLVFSAVHWTSQLRAWRRRKACSRDDKSRGAANESDDSEAKSTGFQDGIGSATSSSSSTLQEDLCPTHLDLGKRQDERIPLVPKARITRSVRRRWILNDKFKAFLTYQPKPIPFINKQPPSNSTTLAIFAFIALQIFYVLFRTPLSIDQLFVLADRMSLLFVANLPILYLFAAKNQPIKLLTDRSYESLNIFHRRLGELMCLLALGHFIGMIAVWFTVLRPLGFSLTRFLLTRMILLGTGAFVAYGMIYFTSLGSFRQGWYELFLGLHVVLQVVALVFVWFHHHGSRVYVGVALLIWLFDRVVYRMGIKSRRLQARLTIMEDEKTVSLSARVPLVKTWLMGCVFGSNINGGWKGTEHVFLTVPSLAKMHIIQAHPFTIASRAPAVNEKEANLDLLIRAQHGFSGDLVRHAKAHNKATIILDGPYGSQSAVHILQHSDHAIVVAGGSGIAVSWPLMHSVVYEQSSRDVEASLSSFQKARLLIWIVRERCHISWIGEARIEELRAGGVEVFIPPPTCENGHPDVAGIISDWVALHEPVTVKGRSKFGVVCSGPDGMNRAVKNTCSALVGQGRNMAVEIEKFGW